VTVVIFGQCHPVPAWQTSQVTVQWTYMNNYKPS